MMGYIVVIFADRIGNVYSKLFKACMYYITMALLFIDPLYLSLLSNLFGGGDMNGIALFVADILARIIYACILVTNIVIFAKIVLPKYKAAFEK